MAFVHLHNHTQYSLLDGACRVDKMINMTKEYGMTAVAMTDHGNMFGTIDFYNKARKENIKPIIGLETYIINHELDAPEAKKDQRYHLVLLAKNLTGYKNLMKLSSKAFLTGFYYKPRISKSLLRKYSEGLICLSGCLKGEIPQLLLNGHEQQAADVVAFYQEIFPNRFYLEIQDHGLEDEHLVQPKLIELAEKTGTPLVVTNDCHYLRKADADAHDVLLCIQTGKSLSETNRMKYNTNQLYFKTEEEMRQLFPSLEEAYDNTVKIAAEIDLELDYKNFLFPKIEHPPQFANHSEYMKELCYANARKLYPEITSELKERIDYELSVIHKMGFEEYFLIVKDLIDAARRMAIPVGPGRGSAVGSVVSYLLGITRIEPLQYGLFFERFLNPDRIGMPDIDIDFCAAGRSRVIDYVIEKYGRSCVAQIITFGTLAAKLVIKDVARVLDVSPSIANEITKLIPNSPKITLEEALKQSREFAAKMAEDDTKISILRHSKVLEGLIRQIGIHAAGVVIGPGSLTNFVPLAVNSQKNGENAVLVQFEGRWLDDLKILKMDILGLKTLTLIQKTVDFVKQYRQIEIDIDKIDLKDKATYELLSNGQTDGIFQFESDGMKKHLCSLQPNVFEDLIAMVALYRPGPMQFIEKYINRKRGREKVSYLHELAENALKETYGVTVYQEQVMRIAREMGGLSGAEADTLRKAISKKMQKTMDLLKVKFVEGSSRNGVPPHVIEKIWTDWQDFAKYAFNKSHAAAYAYVAFQTAFLKAHYPVEFMAALLSLEDNPTKIPNFINECRNLNIDVLPPSINLSKAGFVVQGNKILFGLQAIKNVGTAAISCLVAERQKNGEYKDIFDICNRSDSMQVNRSVLESLICAGALDDLCCNRAQNFKAVETALDFAAGLQAEKKRGQMMLFDAFEETVSPGEYTPSLPEVKEWTLTEKLRREKSVLGFYWSGHPLDRFKEVLDKFINITTEQAEFNPEKVPANIAIAGIVAEISRKTSRRGDPFVIVKLEDLTGRFEIRLFRNEKNSFFENIEEGKEYFILGKKDTYENGKENMLRVLPKKMLHFDQLSEHLSGDYFLKIPEKIFTNEFSHRLLSTLKAHPGKFGVHITVESAKYNVLNLHPRSLRVFPSVEVIKLLNGLDGVNQRINLNFN